jgi:hypothetical protein
MGARAAGVVSALVIVAGVFVASEAISWPSCSFFFYGPRWSSSEPSSAPHNLTNHSTRSTRVTGIVCAQYHAICAVMCGS